MGCGHQVANDQRKGVDFVQEKFMGAGPQDNESALEQAKDEKISDCKCSVSPERQGEKREERG